MKSTLNISRSALQTNFRAVQSVVGDDVEVLAVVKADAYGHGAALCAPVLAEAGAKWFGVSDVEEGAIVRAAVGAGARILVMCGIEFGDAAAMLAHDLTPVVWRPAHIIALQEAALAADTRCRIHLELDTGMTRQGCAIGAELADLLGQLQNASHVICEGVMSHLCCAESAGAETTRRQQARFTEALEQISQAGATPAYIHLANSSAVDEGSTAVALRGAANACGAKLMVRPGFALYGHVLPLEGAAGHAARLSTHLTPALTWTTRVVDVRNVAVGTTVGYGATYVATRDMRLALLPVGYADGFRRAASSGLGDGWVMIAGKRAPVVGRVSMNLTVVDVTDIASVEVGDDAMLLGEGVSAEDHAQWSGTIAYDVLCGIRGNRLLSH